MFTRLAEGNKFCDYGVGVEKRRPFLQLDKTIMQLIGFEKIQEDFPNLISQNKLHHAILLSGKKGIGKASFALNFALKSTNASKSNHPDLLIIKRQEEKRDISIEQIREIPNFINQTSANSKHRFIIIDCADNLNRSSANALLKILEEPNKNCFLILVSHSLSKILPTIKSRCKIAKINDLNYEKFRQAVENARPKILPKLKEEELQTLSLLCDNAPAKAIKKGDEIIEIYRNLLDSILQKSLNNDLTKKISDKKFDFDNFVEIAEFFLLRLMKFHQGEIEFFLLNEKEVFQELNLNFAQIWQVKERFFTQIRAVKTLNLDKKLFLLNFVNYLTTHYARQ